MARLQLARNVDRLDDAVDFSGALVATPPATRRPGYAKFAIDDPPLELVLIENPGHGGTLNHRGVDVAGPADVAAAQQRISRAGLEVLGAPSSTCCYPAHDTLWVEGAPHGQQWEIYAVLADSPTLHADAAQATACCGPDAACDDAPCAPGCC